MIGETILHYKILEKIGEGGMGVVYLAEDTKLERKVAIKFLPHNISSNSEKKERFKIEAKASAALNHPNIATIHSIEEVDNEMFIVMEYVEGKELKDIVNMPQGVSLSINDVINYSTQIAEGLEAAHRKGIIHRDIKSQNIMITNAGKIKIMDFGLAKITGRTQPKEIGTTVGTLAYMSPEQAMGEDVDHRTDIWALGVLIYEMLTGKMPFNGEYEQVVTYSILNEEPEKMEISREDIPDALLHIVKNSLKKNIENRYQYTKDLLADLNKLSNNGSSEIQSTAKAKTINKNSTVKVSPLRKKLIYVIALVCLLAVAVAIYSYLIKDNKLILSAKLNKSLAVMYFKNIPDPEDKKHTGDMITNLLITSLSQIKGVEVISRDQLYKILEENDLSENKIITDKTAIKVAQYAGVSTILKVIIVQNEPSLAVTTQLIDVNSGNVLGSQRLVGFKSEQIFALVDSLALLVKNDLQITQANNYMIKSVATVTTNSPEAYRAYVEGLNLADKLYFKDATIAFKKAIELDSTFAMAYYYLWNVDSDPYESWNFLQQAVKLADNTTERERLLIFAMKYRYQNKRTQAADIYKQIIEKYPHEIEAYEGLIRIQGEKDLGIDVLLRGVQNNLSAKMLWNDLAITYAVNNQKQQALDAVNRYISLSPAEPNPYDTKGEIYAMFMDYDSSVVFYKKALEFRKDFWDTADKLGVYFVIKGKYKEAQKYFDLSGVSTFRYPSINIHRGLLNYETKRLVRALKSTLSQDEENYANFALIHLYYETGQFKKMLQIPEESIKKWKKIYPNDTYGRQWLAWALAKNGQYRKAEEIMEDILKNMDKYPYYVRDAGLFTLATIYFEKGEYEIAIERFNVAFSKLLPNHEPNIFYAICLLNTGRIHEAIAQLNRIKNWPLNDQSYQRTLVPGGRYYSYISNVKAHYWLGVAYQKLEKKEKAIKEYKIFLNTWKDADFDSPEIKNAKIKLAKLD